MKNRKKPNSEKSAKSVKGFNIIKGASLTLVIVIGLFFGIRSVTYRYILNTFRNNMAVNINAVSGQFNNIIKSDMKVLSEVAKIISSNDIIKSTSTSSMLKGMEEESGYSDVFILYSDGTMLDSDLEESVVDITEVSKFFNPSSGLVGNSTISGGNLMVHVPIVEGNFELVAVYDIEYLIQRIGVFYESGASEFVLLDSKNGDIALDVKENRKINERSNNYYTRMENLQYVEDSGYTDIRSSIINGVSGFTGYYDNEELFYACYTGTELDKWSIVQVVPDEIIQGQTVGLRNSITVLLLMLVAVYLILLVVILYINKKRDIENEEIRMQIKVAELANDAKTTFLSNMSHDIRTPLNAIVGLSDICEMNADNPDRVRECIAKQKAASEHLMALINDVLEMNKIESGKVVFMNEEFKIGLTIHNIVMLVQQRMVDKKLKFNVAITNLVHENVIGDEQRIKRAVLNIISNAIKFTDVGGKVSIVINESESDKEGYANYSISVTDTGIGMTEEFLKKIFVPFERMHDSTVSQIEGAGLGMTIAHDLIESLGGNIQVKSQLGQGTTVTVNLPLKIARPDDNSEQYRSAISNYKDQYIVVVDNDVMMVEWMDKLISSLGLKCISTTSCSDALDVVKKMKEMSQSVALMIFGWKMPKMSGTELASKMRGIVGNDVPIILQTVHDFNENDDEIRTSGINKILVEPIFRSDLMEVFYEMLNGGNDSKMTFPDFSGKRVLLVEDHKVNAEIISEYLSYTGIEVDVVYDGTEAVKRMEETPDGYYDLIFMDIRMPKMNGYDATREIRAMRSDYTRNIPIIALSANAFIEDKKNSQKVGMNGHIAKPVKYEELYAELKKWF